jgi:hypothetical protein
VIVIKKLTSIRLAFLAFSSVLASSAASAEDEIGISVDVLGTAGAPEVRANFSVPFGKKSDAAKISFSIAGFEPSRDVFFKVTPLPDAFAREVADEQGSVKTKLELPYGLEPGRHEIVAETFFSSDDIPASYTVGEFFVNDFGLLVMSDGSYPKGTKPAPVLLPNSAQAFKTAPKFLTPKGSLRVSEPQLRITQSWLPSATAGVSFNNSTNNATTFSAKITLLTVFGTAVGEPYYASIDGLPSGDTKTVLLEFKDLPPVGFFTLRTELELPADFSANVPVATTVSSSIFVAPYTAWGLFALILVLVAVSLAAARRAKGFRKIEIGKSE